MLQFSFLEGATQLPNFWSLGVSILYDAQIAKSMGTMCGSSEPARLTTVRTQLGTLSSGSEEQINLPSEWPNLIYIYRDTAHQRSRSTVRLPMPRGSNMNRTSSTVYPSQNGDFVIQTSDGVLFGVHSLLLRLSSTVMNDMLTVGSGSEDRNPGRFVHSRPCGCLN